MKKRLLAIFIFLLVVPSLRAEEKKTPNPNIEYASVEQGKEILGQRDDYVSNLSPFDRQSRLKTDKEVTEKEFVEFAASNVIAWSDADKKKIDPLLADIQKQCAAFALPFPDTVLLIKTTGKEEANAAYTRANAVILPRSQVNMPPRMLRDLIAHELFHVLSRRNSELRDKLYAAIGFEKCRELVYPAKLQAKKISNPDATTNDHWICLTIDGKSVWAIPLIFSATEHYNTRRGGDFFNYLQFRLLLVESDAQTSPPTPVYEEAALKLVDLDQVTGFFEQVGKNTSYTIHPEEILADNFQMLLFGGQKIPSPEILQKMKDVLVQFKGVSR